MRNLKFLKVDLEKLEGEIGIAFPGCHRKSKSAFFHLYPEGEVAKKVEASGANQLEQLVYMHFSTVKIIEKTSSLEFKDALEGALNGGGHLGSTWEVLGGSGSSEGGVALVPRGPLPPPEGVDEFI